MDAHDFCSDLAKTYKSSIRQVVSILSILSPSNKWERNKEDTTSLYEHYTSGKSVDELKVCTYGHNKHKAWELLNKNLEVFESSGEKTLCFRDNIVNPHTSQRVTIDRWAARIAYRSRFNTIIQLNTKNYRILEGRFRKSAEYLGFLPHQVQAITWVTYKRMSEEAKTKEAIKV